MSLGVNIDTKALDRARLLYERSPRELRLALRRANYNASAKLLKRIKDNLSGVKLNVRTGNLRRNWSLRPVKEIPNGYEGGTGSGRTVYAAYHEFGYHGSVQVRAHERRFSQVFGRPASGTAEVRAHSRNVNYPGHAYARPAFDETKAELVQIHVDEIEKTLKRIEERGF